ncbi:Purine catabolism regulatory protein-like family protein [Actinacidiphila alni]|uniref:Purine catabolism regulatory protein-like family protein n=1 Tax=Actinacidiphila alni TaxID=380248 RepID=A0A1I2AYC2_9ACTN|nr:PucR family transcriptional regulator [Actinacidiphila alni]SFE47983.1 Purine catabolism regulatory protein-like family protein [Actinacidiphila alni]
MHVHDLLQLDRLGLTLLWGDRQQLDREISGVTATDLADPRRFLQHGEIVLSGLVWWRPQDDPAKADRFVTALRTAGAVALLAGEETHGAVPDVLVRACRAGGVPVIAVPARTSFRAITEVVYLRQWGDLSRRPHQHYALPEHVRTELGRLLAADAEPDVLLGRGFADLANPACYLLTASGRTVARTPGAPVLPAPRAAEHLARSAGAVLPVAADSTPFDAWWLHLPDATAVPPRVLDEMADVLGRHRRDRAHRESAAVDRGSELAALLAAPAGDGPALRAALRACGLPENGPYQVAVVAARATADAGTPPDPEPGAEAGPDGAMAVAALTEALRHHDGPPFAVGRLPGDEALAVAVVASTGRSDAAGDIEAQVRETWPWLTDRQPAFVAQCGLGSVVSAPWELAGSLVQARYALTVARTSAPGSSHVMSAADLSTARALLGGVPATVRAAYRARVLGPLADGRTASHRVLLETLETFLANSGSWARTAEVLHLHVNTVRYRVQRIEALTGRDLSKLENKLDLRTALLCG